MNNKVIVIGGAVEDVIFYTPDGKLIKQSGERLLAFAYDAKIRIERVFPAFGGGAANVAVTLARLGLKSLILACIGKDQRGTDILRNFKAQGVDISLIQKDSKIESGFSFVVIGPQKEHIVFSHRGANANLVFPPKQQKVLISADWIYFTSLSGAWKDIIKQTFALGRLIAWNPGEVQLAELKFIKPYLKKTNILFLNQQEARELVGKNISDEKKLLSAVKSLGPQIVVITRGQDGAGAYDGKKFYHQGIIKEGKRVDTTGVGDAFNAAFLAGMISTDNNFQKSLLLGAHNAAGLISQPGSQNGLIDSKKMQQLLKIN